MSNNYKGLDDLLAAGLKPNRIRGAGVAEFFRQRRAQLFGDPEATTFVPPPAPPPAGRPPFPIDIFPEPVAGFVRRVAAAMGCPPDFPALGALVVAGAAVGAARSLKVKGGWYEKPGMYAVIVARPGTTKTPALRAVMGPVYQQQDRLYQERKAAVKKYKQDLQAHKDSQRHPQRGGPAPVQPEEPAPMRHVYVADTTVEELANNLKDNAKGFLLFRDELTAWVRSLDQYKGKGTDRQFFLSAWSGEMVKVDRKGHHDQPVVVPHPFVAVLGGIQPDLLGELEAEGGREDGFLHRVLFSYPDECGVTGWVEDELTADDQDGWQRVLNRLFIMQPENPPNESERPKQLQLSADGKDAFRAYCDRLAGEMRGEDFPSWMHGPCSKLRAYCARFALVLHLLRVACGEAGGDQDEGQVDADDVGRAVSLCDYFAAHYRAVFARLRLTQEDQKVEDLVGWMRRKGLETCKVRDVCRANVVGIKTASEAAKLFDAAADHGLGDLTDGSGANSRNKTRAQRSFTLRKSP